MPWYESGTDARPAGSGGALLSSAYAAAAVAPPCGGAYGGGTPRGRRDAEAARPRGCPPAMAVLCDARETRGGKGTRAR